MFNKTEECCCSPPRPCRSWRASAYAAGGLITIIVNDPANPYWLTEGNVAEADGREARLHRQRRRPEGRHQHREQADRHRHHQQVGRHHPRSRPTPTARSAPSRRRSPPASRCSSSTPRSTRKASPRRSSSPTTPRARRSARSNGCKVVGEKGNYVELLGAPSDNNAATRSNGYETVLSQYPDLKKVGSQVANWDRTQGHDKMQSCCRPIPTSSA